MAVTTIDELVVSISLNAEKFYEEQKKVNQEFVKFKTNVTESASRGEHAAQGMIDAFSRVTKEVLGLGAAILGVNSLKELAINTVNAAASVERLATALDINPILANKWANLMNAVSGQSAGVTISALGELKRAVEQFQRTSQGPFLQARPAMTAMGLRMPDINENPDKFIEQFLLNLGEAAKLPKNRNDLSFMLTQIPGMSALNLGLREPNLDRQLAQMQTITEEQLKAADQILRDVKEIERILTRFVNSFLPPTAKVVHGVAGGVRAIDEGRTVQGVHDIAGALVGNPNQIKADTTKGWGWLMSQGLLGMYFQSQKNFPDPGLIMGGNPNFVNPNIQSGRELPPVTINVSTLMNGQNARQLGQTAADAFYDALGIQGNAGLH